MERSISVLDLPGSFAFGECHIQRDAGHDRLPCVVVRQPFALDRAPMMHNLVFGDAVEELLFAFWLGYGNRMVPHMIARPVTLAL